jgi:negative regulator of flagellin synthesis FlgM
MKIGQPDNKAPLNPLAGDRRAEAAQGRKQDAAAPAGEPGTQVALSAAALAAQDPGTEFDAAKVERIALAIAEGKFQVNAEVIADKLIANAQELLGKSSH